MTIKPDPNRSPCADQPMNKAWLLVAFLVVALWLVLYSTLAFANAPVLSDLRLAEHVPIVSSISGKAWVVALTVDVLHDDAGANPIGQVSNLTIRAYDAEAYRLPDPVPIVEYVDPSFHPNQGNAVDDYPVFIEIPKSASGYLIIEACAEHDADRGCTTWEGWIPQEPGHTFSGDLQMRNASAWDPWSAGLLKPTFGSCTSKRAPQQR